MTLWLLLRNLRIRWFANLLTTLAVALGVAVALAVPLTLQSLREGIIRASNSFDLLIAARGSPIQAVLNSLFYQDRPIGNLPYSLYEKLSADPRTKTLIPLAFGDNYNGFYVVGTSSAFFELREKLSSPPLYGIIQGRAFNQPFEAVVGAQVAKTSGLTLGSKFKTSHGLIPSLEPEEHAEEYTVVGILAPSGAPGDRAVYTSIETIWQEHQEHGAEANHQPEVTAMLLTPTRLGYVYQIAAELERDKLAQGVFPGQVIGQLLDLMGQGRAGFDVIGILVLLLALTTVAVNTLSSAAQAQRNLAVLRLIGASRGRVFALVLLESGVIAGLGVLLGVGLAYGITRLAADVVSNQTGVVLPILSLEQGLALRALLMIPIALVFAWLPAWRATTRSPLEPLR